MNAHLPPDEHARLQALYDYQILDTLAEQSYDDITMLASYICDTPVALISLVDETRQWFKSRVGLQARETPREQAFCAHTILDPRRVMVIPDAHKDSRFRDNPLVTGQPGIRFYAGAPIVTPDGHALGTVCVIDTRPREIDDRQRQALRALAGQAEAQLELRRTVSKLERYKREIEAANARLAEQSLTDALTGLGNRRAFDDSLQQELDRARRHETPLSLILLDLDKFKPYNDSFGHQAGDEILKAMGDILGRRDRNYDFCARYGGEEFAVILPGTAKADALTVAERLRREVESRRWPHRQITVSAGVATSPGGRDRPRALIERADMALYAAKDHGGNVALHAGDLNEG